jgi:hypothetical protein
MKNIFSAQIPAEVVAQLNRAAEKLYPTLVSDMRLRSILWISVAIFLFCLSFILLLTGHTSKHRDKDETTAGFAYLLMCITFIAGILILLLNISGVVYPEAALFREILK